MTLTRIAHSIVLASGWRRALLAFFAGVASALALPPINAWPVLFLTFPVLVWLVDGSAAGRWSGTWRAFGAGWCFGFGYFLAGLYWIGYAFLVDAKTFGWLLPIAVGGLPAVLALYTAVGLALARLMWVRGTERVAALAVALTVTEWLRGHLFTGFPWNTFGYALTEPLALAQSVSLVGIWGLTFLSVAIFASPAVLTDEAKDTPHPFRAPVAALVVLAAMAGFGLARLHAHPTVFVKGVKLRIMQADLQQDEKFNYADKNKIMARYLALSDRATGPQVERRARHHTSDLAGIVVSVFSHARAGTAGQDRLADQAAHRADHRRGARWRRQIAGSKDVHAYNSIYVIDPGRLDPRHLRQGASGAVRRIPAVRAAAQSHRPAPAHAQRRRFSCGRPPARDGRAGRAEDAAA